MDDQLLHKIEMYIANAMTPEERIAFDEQLLNNPELEREVALQKQLTDYLSNRYHKITIPENNYTKELGSFIKSENAQKIKETLKKGSTSYHINKAKPKSTYIFWVAASIVILLSISIGFFNFNNSTTDELYANFYKDSDLPSIVQRGNQQSLFQEGVVAFQNLNYKEAIEKFEQYKSEANIDEIDYSVFLYVGVAYSKENDLKNSILNLDKMITSTSLDASKGLWFKALSFLNADEIEMSKIVLKELLKDSSNFNYEEAKDLLRNL